jgi:SpoVK/Ycf46/Vps4 family AAA+-type ATPase
VAFQKLFGMSNFETSFCQLVRARFPFVYIPTPEEERVMETISNLARDEDLIRTPREVFVWKITEGLIGSGTKKSETHHPIQALDFVARYDKPALFLMLDFYINFGNATQPPEYAVLRKIRDLSGSLKRSVVPKTVVFISPLLVLPIEIQKEVALLHFDLPTLKETSHLLQKMMEAHKDKMRIEIDLPSEDVERLAKAALGLTLQEAENAFARAIVNDGRLDASDINVVLEEKRQNIQKTGLLEFVQNDYSIADVGGLGNLKSWLQKRQNAWLESAHDYGLSAPNGVLITGVPGCGKSLVAKTISALWQLPMLRLDVGRIFSGLIGSSEENMRAAIGTAEALAPSILWIDEIEKGFDNSRGGGDSGTSARVFGTFLTWMQEKQKPVFVVATSNDISALPAEMLRKGRFDEIFFVDLPTLIEREYIWKLHLQKRLVSPQVRENFPLDSALISQLAQRSEGFSGAEIEAVIIAGLFEAFSEKRSLLPNDLRRAIHNTVPLSVTQAEQIQAVREWAQLRAVAATSQHERAGYAAMPTQPQPRAAELQRGGRALDF